MWIITKIIVKINRSQFIFLFLSISISFNLFIKKRMNNPAKKEVPAAIPLQNTKVFPNIKVTIFMKGYAQNNALLFRYQ